MAQQVNSGELNEKQRRFCEEYVIDLNGTQAAIRAGYSRSTAEAQSSRLLANVNIQAYLAQLREKTAAKLQITFEDLLNQYRRLAFQDIRKYYNEDGSLKKIHELDDDAAAALAGVDVDEITVEDMVIGTTKKIKRWDPVKALEAIGKHLGFFETDNKQKQPVMAINNLSDSDLAALAKIQKKTG